MFTRANPYAPLPSDPPPVIPPDTFSRTPTQALLADLKAGRLVYPDPPSRAVHPPWPKLVPPPLRDRPYFAARGKGPAVPWSVELAQLHAALPLERWDELLQDARREVVAQAEWERRGYHRNGSFADLHERNACATRWFARVKDCLSVHLLYLAVHHASPPTRSQPPPAVAVRGPCSPAAPDLAASTSAPDPQAPFTAGSPSHPPLPPASVPSNPSALPALPPSPPDPSASVVDAVGVQKSSDKGAPLLRLRKAWHRE